MPGLFFNKISSKLHIIRYIYQKHVRIGPKFYTNIIKQEYKNLHKLKSNKLFLRQHFLELLDDIKINSYLAVFIYILGDTLGNYYIHKQIDLSEIQTTDLFHPPPKNTFNDFLKFLHKSYVVSNDGICRLVTRIIQGVTLNGILACLFYRFLDIALGDARSKRKFWPIIPLKIFLIQSLFMPITIWLYLIIEHSIYYIFSVCRLEKKLSISPKKLISEAIAKNKIIFKDLYIKSWFLWPLVDSLNMRYIALRYRPVVDSSVDTLWISYVTYLCHRDRNNK